MKTRLQILLIWGLLWFGWNLQLVGQNLIPNPSFEVLIDTPCIPIQNVLIGERLEDFIEDWVQPTQGTADLFATYAPANCFAGGGDILTLQGDSCNFGPQGPRSGEGYMGLYFNANSNYQEYAQTPLLSRLQVGQTYCGEYYISWGENSTNFARQFGMLFTNDQIDRPNYHERILDLPQIVDPSYVKDSLNWYRIGGTFVASDTFGFVTIGVFNTPNNSAGILLYAQSHLSTTPSGCNWKSSYYYVDDVSVLPYVQPDVSVISPQDTVCAQTPYTLEATGAGNYSWSTLANPQEELSVSSKWTILPDTTTTYILTGRICDLVDRDTFTLYVRPPANANLGSDTTMCEFNPIVLSAANNAVSYLWSDSSTQSTFTANGPGLYWVESTDSYGCSFRDSIQVNLGDVQIQDLGPDTSLCSDEIYVLNIGNQYTDPIWSDGRQTYINSIQGPGVYWVQGTDSIGCQVSDTLVVNVAIQPPALGADQALCVGDSIMLSPLLSYATYQWSDGSNDNVNWVHQAGAYQLIVSNQRGCIDSSSINIFPGETPLELGMDLTWCAGDTFFLEPSGDWLDYLWSDGSTETSLSLSSPGLYYLAALNDNLCWNRDSIIVQNAGNCPGTLEMPNLFSPNADGINDVFRPLKAQSIEDFRMQIYDRWGRRVFETQLVDTGWAGQAFGEAAPGGVYYWIVKYTDDEGQEFVQKGNLLLAR